MPIPRRVTPSVVVRTDRRSASRLFLVGQLLSVVAWVGLATLVIADVRLQPLFLALGGVVFVDVFLADRGSRAAGLHWFGPGAVAQAAAEIGLRPRLVLGFDAALLLTAVTLTIV